MILTDEMRLALEMTKITKSEGILPFVSRNILNWSDPCCTTIRLQTALNVGLAFLAVVYS